MNQKQPWAVRVVALLLLLQAAGFLIIALYSYNQLVSSAGTALPGSPAIIFAYLRSSFYAIILALLSAVAAAGLWWGRRPAWGMAMVVQGVTLFFSLFAYFNDGPWFMYLGMGYGILMVLYLHHPDVQTVFQTKTAVVTDEELG